MNKHREKSTAHQNQRKSIRNVVHAMDETHAEDAAEQARRIQRAEDHQARLEANLATEHARQQDTFEAYNDPMDMDGPVEQQMDDSLEDHHHPVLRVRFGTEYRTPRQLRDDRLKHQLDQLSSYTLEEFLAEDEVEQEEAVFDSLVAEIEQDFARLGSHDVLDWYPWTSKAHMILDLAAHNPRDSMSRANMKMFISMARCLGASHLPTYNAWLEEKKRIKALFALGPDDVQVEITSSGDLFYINSIAGIISRVRPFCFVASICSDIPFRSLPILSIGLK